MHIAAVWYPVRQWEAAKQFYAEMLGLPLTHFNDAAGWAAFATGGPPLFIIRQPAEAGQRGGAVVTFSGQDLEALRDRLAAAGLRVEDEMTAVGNLLIMTFYDPDGNRLEASQLLEAE